MFYLSEYNWLEYAYICDITYYHLFDKKKKNWVRWKNFEGSHFEMTIIISIEKVKERKERVM